MKYKIMGKTAKRNRHPQKKIAPRNSKSRLRHLTASATLAQLPLRGLSACANVALAVKA